MTRFVGLERDASGLREALLVIDQLERISGGEPALLNMTASAKLVAAAALRRTESRGGHYRTDAPQTAAIAQRTFLMLADAEAIMGTDGNAANLKSVAR